MTVDPRTEEIRELWELARLAGIDADDARNGWDRAKINALSRACQGIPHPLGRIEALEGVADKAREWRRVEDLVATSDEYRGSEKAIVAGYRIMADAKSALLAALAALDGQS